MRLLRLILGTAFAAAAAVPAAAQLQTAGKIQAPITWTVAQNGHVPTGALIAGVDNNAPAAICRILHQGALYPGRLVRGACRIGFQGREVAATRYEVLLGDPRALQWLNGHLLNKVPPGAITGGFEQGPRPSLLCRAIVPPVGVLPGRYFGNGCVVSHIGGELAAADFEVVTLARLPTFASLGGKARGAMAFDGGLPPELLAETVVEREALEARSRDIAAGMTAILAEQNNLPNPQARAAVTALDDQIKRLTTLLLDHAAAQGAARPATRAVPAALHQAIGACQDLARRTQTALDAQAPNQQLLLTVLAKQLADLAALRAVFNAKS